MSQFVFQENLLPMDIAGISFEVDPTKAEGSIMELVSNIESIKTNLTNGKTNPAAVQEACSAMKAAVDAILGKDACKKIFAGREASFYDCLDLCMFLMREVNAFTEQKRKEYGINTAAAKKKTARK